jgi:septation ring formation regulator EzrA
MKDLKHHVNIEDGVTTGITTDDMERMVAVSNSQILQVREEMCTSVVELSAQIATVSESVKRQNVCVVAVQKMLESTSADIKNIVNEKVTDLTAQINNLRSLVQSLLPHSALQAGAWSKGQGGS